MIDLGGKGRGNDGMAWYPLREGRLIDIRDILDVCPVIPKAEGAGVAEVMKWFVKGDCSEKTDFGFGVVRCCIKQDDPIDVVECKGGG